jgi:hypothetical protein
MLIIQDLLREYPGPTVVLAGLGLGILGQVAIECLFEPGRIVVDPDAQVLQFERKAVVARF